MTKKTLTLCLLLLISASFVAAEETTWLDLLDEQNKQILLQDEEMVAAFDNTVMGEPLLVNEGLEDSYYLVPFNKDGGTTGVIMIDAEEGFFRQIARTEQPEKYLAIGKEDAVQGVKADINPAPTETLEVEFDYGEAETELLWEPGPYSQSPFKPFWKISLGGGEWIVTQQETFYEIVPVEENKANTTVIEIEGDAPNAEGFYFTGTYYEITNSDLNNGKFSVTLTFYYNDVDNGGIVDGTMVHEPEMKLYYFGEEGWIEVENIEKNTEENWVRVTIDHFTVFALMEEQPAPAPEPVPEPEPQNTGGSGWLGGGGGGGSSAKLDMEIEGNFAGEEIAVKVLNTYGKPSADAKVTVTKDMKVVEEKKTDKDGMVFFTLEKAGEYNFIATKRLYTVNSQVVEIIENTAVFEEGPKEKEPEPIEEPEPAEEPLEQPKAEENQYETNTQELGQEIKATGTGLFVMKQEPEINALLIGIFAAMIVGAGLYLKKRLNK